MYISIAPVKALIILLKYYSKNKQEMMRYLSLSPLCVLFFLIFNSRVCFSSASVVPQCHPDESSALLQFKGSFSPTSSFDACVRTNDNPTPWNESTNCCTWGGITCDEVTGHVIGLDLSCYTTRKGAISSNSSLFFLRHLQSLVLSDIDVEGSPILPEFGQFKNLTYLELSYANFSGHVPLEISHLSKLVSLSLSGYYPDQLTIEEDTFKALAKNLTSLTELSFVNVDMSSVSPLSLTNLSSSLTSLYLLNSNLHGELPENMFQMSKLEELALIENHLNGQIPCFFLNLQRLKVLYLSYNNFSGQLPEVCSNFSHKSPPDGSSKYLVRSALANLTVLSLEGNLLNGTIPSWIYEKPYLEQLELGNNLFTGEIREFKSTSLQRLSLSENKLRGIIPRSILHQGQLMILDLSSNNLTGPLPIPSAPGLVYFGASKNQFSGDIPTSICNMTSLWTVDLSHNNLSGIIPQCLGDFSTSLQVVDLRMNKLHGPIPATFAEGNSLKYINLNGNELEGLLSRSLVHCRNLEVLDVGNNRLRDTFPDWLESLPKLQVLVLRANKFNGSIGNPKTRSPFRQLRIMDISYNEFRGTLPIRYIENFTAMMDADKVKMEYMVDAYLLVYFYSIVVSMKGLDELVKIQTLLTTIDFSSNNFTSQIPQSIGRLESLKGLNFSHNKLHGTIPSSLGNLTNLEWLDLSSNELIGRIPDQLADIPWLAFLNLSHNKLVGPIPSGRQFNTFNNNSYSENPGLCGFPLSKLCGNREVQPDQGDDGEHDEGMFDMKVVIMGYASGLVIGISVGYMMLFSRSGDHWFMKRLGGERRLISIPPLRGRSRRRNLKAEENGAF